MTWAVAVLIENKSIRMFRTQKQAGWMDKAGKLSMKGVGFSPGAWRTQAEWSRMGIEKLSYLEPPNWSSGLVGHTGFGFTSERC